MNITYSYRDDDWMFSDLSFTCMIYYGLHVHFIIFLYIVIIIIMWCDVITNYCNMYIFVTCIYL